MFERFDEAAAYVRQHGVTMVDLKFCDLAGRWRHVTLPAERFTPELMEDGVGFDGSSVGLRSVKSGDLVLVPDLATAFVDPFPEEKTLSFLCRILEADDRSPVLFDPRTIAARAEERLRASGVGTRSLWGPEFEFYLFDGVAYENGVNVASYRVESSEADWRSHELGSGFTIPRHGGYHALPPQDHLDDARTKISRILESVGVPVKYHHHEVGGPGQCEIEIPLPGPPRRLRRRAHGEVRRPARRAEDGADGHVHAEAALRRGGKRHALPPARPRRRAQRLLRSRQATAASARRGASRSAASSTTARP